MGRKEEPLIHYYDQPAHFAELINGWIYDGEDCLSPEDITQADRRLEQRSGKRPEKGSYRQRCRDIFKQAGELNIRLFVGVELQENMDYSMPLRVMDMDMISYTRHVETVVLMSRVKD